MFFKRPSYSAFRRRLAAYEARLTALEHELASKPWKRNILIPCPDVYVRGAAEPFMQYSTCSALDFFHPRFSELSALLRIPVSFHRKYWEWVYILNVALARGLSATSAKVLGFGVGATEPLPAVFAKLGASVTATDAP